MKQKKKKTNMVGDWLQEMIESWGNNKRIGYFLDTSKIFVFDKILLFFDLILFKICHLDGPSIGCIYIIKYKKELINHIYMCIYYLKI